MKPLIYLELRQFVNSIRNAARSPKRLIPALLIAAWLAASIFQNLMLAAGVNNRPLPSMDALRQLPFDTIWFLIFLFLSIIAGLIVYNALKESLLIFAPAHVDFLFPTPIKRRTVLAEKLLRDYAKYAIYVALACAVIGSPLYGAVGARPFPAAVVTCLGAFLLIVFVMNVTHTLNIITTFGMHRLRYATRLAKLIILGILMLIAVTAAIHYVRNGDAFLSLVAATRNGIASILLAPAAWCTDLILAPLSGVISETYLELLWLFLLAVGSTILLLSRPENIYEPSLGISVRMAQIRAAIRSGDMAALRSQSRKSKGKSSYAAPPIRPFGRGATAMLWKNLVISLRAPARVIIVVLLPLGLAIAIKSLVHDAILLNMTPLAIPYTVLMLTFAAERELRGELRQANIIKAMPVSGTQMVLVLVLYWWLLTLVVVAVIAASILLFIPQAGLSILGISVICSLAFSFACLSALSIPPLLYSDARDWLQAMISQFFSLFLVGIVVMPTGITLAILLMLKVNLVITSLVIVVVNVVLGWCALSIAGLLFARFDPTSD